MKKDFAKEYATALFDLSLDSRNVDLIQEQLKIVKESFTTNGEFIKLLTHPKVTKDEKRDVIKSIYSSFDRTLLNFLYVLVENERIQYLEAIYVEFDKLVNEYNKVIVVEAQSAQALTKSQIERLTGKLTIKYKHRIEINNVITPAIVGGVRLLINDEIIDNSVKSQLSNLKSHILKQN
jgi:F-type H+-transporting ATPase subunit delta